jgi:hypothetical protein
VDRIYSNIGYDAAHMQGIGMPRRIAGLARLFVIFALLSCASAFAAVRVVESTPSRVVLSWELANFDTATVGGNQTSISYDGGHVPTGHSGSAFIPAYSIHVGAPARGAVRVSVTPEEVSSVRLNNPLRKHTGGPDSAAPVFVSRWVSEPLYGMMRDYRAAHLLLRPVHDMGQGRVQLLKRARVVIDFPAAAHTGETWRPRGEFERIVERLFLNFSVAQGWQEGKSSGLRKAADGQIAPYPLAFDKKLAMFKVGDGNKNLNEGLTNENSLIKIRGSAIRKIFGSSVPIASVALYASARGEMDVLVPPANDIPPGIYELPAMRYDLNGNGVVDDNDYVVAYVAGASGWAYNAGTRQFSFSINRYDDARTYWLAVKDGAGAKMERFDQPQYGGGVVRETFENNMYLRTPQVESQADNNHEGGLEWAWRRFTPSRMDTTIRLDLPGIDERVPGSIMFRSGSLSYGSISAELGTKWLCSSCGNQQVDVADWRSKDLVIKFSGRVDNPSAYYELNAIHVRYGRTLALSDAAGKLEIFSSTGADTARYRLSRADGGGLAYIVRVLANDLSVSLVDTVRARSYEWSDAGNRGARYMAMLEKDIVDYSDSLVEIDSRSVVNGNYQIRDLRNPDNATDFLIITHEEFLSAAIKLAEHKFGMGFTSPKVVLLNDILNQFGGGNTDPAAIRNFLYYVYGNWRDGSLFSYVTLFGAGHYDYKNISSRVANFMPVPYINNGISDDFYVFFDASLHPGSQHNGYYFLGRLPARNSMEAFDMVGKIIETEDPRVAEFDAWRGRVLLAADDDQQGAKMDGSKDYHVSSSEKVSKVITGRRPDVDQRKVYLFEYPWDDRYYKPAATRTLINEINNGVAVVNWFGHGAIDLVADERLMKTEDITALYNQKRYPLFCLFSCSIAKFDRPGDVCLASMLVRQPGAGAIAVIASAREVYPSANENLALPFFDALFGTMSGENLSFGSALTIAKAKYINDHNRYYVVLGDPSITLTSRGRNVAVSFTDTAGIPLYALNAMQQIVIKGTVMNINGVQDEGFGGGAYASVTLFNPPQDSARRKDGGKFSNPVYSLQGTPVFSAKIPIVNGAFEQQILLPMNLAFGKQGVKVSAYVWKEREALTGAGYLDWLIFEGSQSGNLSDTLGPKISIRPIYNSEAMDRAGLFVRNRVTAQLPLTLEVSIEDENGINVMGAGPDEGLTMEVKGALSKRSVNHLLQFSEGSFRHGTATLTFEENSLKGGTYELIISAQDLLGNVSRLSAALEIVDPSDLKLDHVINVPNPVKMGRETRFYYYHSNAPGDLNVNVTVRVYSLGGRLLSVIRNPRNGEAWVPMDGKGNLLTPNVYLYQVTASSSNIGKTVKSKIKKLVVHPPR